MASAHLACHTQGVAQLRLATAKLPIQLRDGPSLDAPLKNAVKLLAAGGHVGHVLALDQDDGRTLEPHGDELPCCGQPWGTEAAQVGSESSGVCNGRDQHVHPA